MPTHDYHFVTRWQMPAAADTIMNVLRDPQDLPRWWPAVYLGVKEIAAGDEKGVGKRITLYTKGWLPYTLRWEFEITEAEPPRRFALTATGDFVGRGVWTFEPNADGCLVTYEWRIRAEKPLLKRLSFILKPLFAMNHRWAMARGEESLRLELQRRQTPDPAERAKIPAPPPATPARPLRWLVYVLRGR